MSELEITIAQYPNRLSAVRKAALRQIAKHVAYYVKFGSSESADERQI